MNADQNNLTQLIAEIPFFRDLAPPQVKQILPLFRRIQVQAGQVLFEEGAESQEMYLLLSGRLSVKTRRVDLGEILAVGVVGEMGVITGQPRSATVVASEDSRLFAIRKIGLDILLSKNTDIGMQVYRNLSRILCDRLAANNIRLEDYAHPQDEAPDEV